MCGIAGLILAPGAPPPDPATLATMIGSLAHRGPDGSGHTVVGRIALLHNRLAIIDLETGDQPLFAGQAALVANGEVYNYRELRAGLPGVNFTTNSDCEPPLHLWLRDGPGGYARHLRGMFAIAVHDRVGRTITLTRDPFGIKPLYTAQVAGGLAFASEPQAILATGLVGRRLRPTARSELLQLQFTTGTETIFEGIHRVLPGETLTCSDGHILSRNRIPALPDTPTENIGEDAALARLDRALEESVDLHQRSDVPYGMFLSGGIDSATLLALMARLNSQPVLAFTAGWDGGAADERAHAAVVARAAGARHETIEISEAMVWRHLPEIVACMDDPTADYAIIPTWFLAQRARQDVKVVLCGEGGDEIFGGYGRYRSAMRPWWLGGRVMRARGCFDRVDVLRAPPVGWRDGYAASEGRAAEGGRSRLAAAQATDVADWLPHDLLLKLDRCLMAHAVEGRTPFLDPGVAAAGFPLPDVLKVRQGRGKWLLRKWLEKHLPEANPWAPKQGFTVPVGTWIASQGSRLGPLVAGQPGVAEIADRAKVEALFRNCGTGWPGGFAAWSLLFYALWHNRHILGLAAGGDVFEVLATK
ncbi:MAG: asparagine synthase (glutamine-hydrolyzing) [Alphaproteobacteria bacterium]|nr:asparagine synthase (glutamine-hydrolyzing) [Alphaproteobacteria bacterium]